MSVQLPRLLDASGRERARLQPTRLSLSLRLSPLSTAVMTLPWDAPAPAARDLVELFDLSGSVGVFRAVSEEAEPGLSRTIHLEHGLASLADEIVPAASMTGTVREVLSALMACQQNGQWQLGDIDVPEDMTLLFTCGCQPLLTAVMNVMALLPDGYRLDYDQRSLPWTLHLRALDNTAFCEGRLSRNLTGLRVSRDCADLCTRVYPYGAGQGTERISLTPLTGTDYMQSDAAAVWGVISRTITVSSIFDAPTLHSVALKYLERHREPAVSVEAGVIDLSAATGEPIDAFRPGRMCRLLLPEEKVSLAERIVSLEEPDVIATPGLIRVSLCSRVSDASDEIADILREVTASKILGGRVTDVTTNSRANGTSTSRIEHYFRVDNIASVLGATAWLDPDDGVRVVEVRVDENLVPSSAWADNVFSILPYLKRDALGLVTGGRHTLAIYPDSGAVNSTITLKVIQNI